MREIEGRPVVSDEPTMSGIVDRAGNPVVWQQTRTLTLADGTVVYGCAHCDYVNRNRASIRPHLGAHNRRRNGHQAGAELTLKELRRLALKELLADRDRWKERALRAERTLRTIHTAITGGRP